MAYKSKRRATRRRSVRRSPAPRRRRRLGAIGKRRESITRLAGLIVGAVLPVFAGKIKVNGNPIDGKIVGAASLAIGYFLPSMVKGDLVAGIGDGLLASGGVVLLTEFNVLAGIPVIAGWRDMPTIAGPKVGNVSPSKSIIEAGQNSSFRPSVSQMINGVYNRRSVDGYDD